MDSVQYSRLLMHFVNALNTPGRSPTEYVSIQTGRKYDKIIFGTGVRYFIDKSTGVIYGARSRVMANEKWYFGTLETVDLWDWSGYHGQPINDPSVRLVGHYGPYSHFLKVE